MSSTIIGNANENAAPYPPHVQASKVQFNKEDHSRLLGVSGWDGLLYIYNVDHTGQFEQLKYFFSGKPILCFSFAGTGKIANGGAERNVKLNDLETSKETILGSHERMVRCMEYSSFSRALVTGSWDATVKIWDVRNRGVVQEALLDERVYAMDVHDDSILVGTKDRQILLFDARNMKAPVFQKESPLKFQTRCVSFFPEGDSYVVTSIEGRVAVEYVNQAPRVQKNKYVFKCHRGKKDADGVENVYPVNAVAFHPKYSTFATGGSDAMVNIWDPFSRKRIVQLRKFEAGVVSLGFNWDGSQLAIATSYAYEYEIDPTPLPATQIIVKNNQESDVRPK